MGKRVSSKVAEVSEIVMISLKQIRREMPVRFRSDGLVLWSGFDNGYTPMSKEEALELAALIQARFGQEK